MSVKLTARVSAIPEAIVGKTDTLRFKELHASVKTGERGRMSKGGPPRSRKIKVWLRDHFRCRYCSRPVETPSDEIPLYLWATVDHKVPRSKGGSNKTDNLVTSCMTCNKRKADSDHASFVASGKAVLSYNKGFRSLADLKAGE